PRIFRDSPWNGSHQPAPLDPEELLDLLAEDLLEEPDIERALNRLMARGGQRPSGDRLQGLRDLIEQLRARRQEQLNRYNLDSPMDDIGEKLRDIVEQERAGIERRLEEARALEPPAKMKKWLQVLAARKRQSLDTLPAAPAGMMKQLLDYEFMDPEAREAFDRLVNELRQKVMGSYFQGL